MDKEILGSLELNRIYQLECIEGMSLLPDKSIDLICCDLPYGVTSRNKWDSTISFDDLWTQYKRIIKDNGAIVLFAQDKFTAKLMLSNEKWHRYNLVWDKVMTTGFLNANKMPLRSHEDICVFYNKLPTYNPQKILGKKSHSKGNKVQDVGGNNYREVMTQDNSELHGDWKFPKSILTFEKVHPSVSVHPTQKPVELCEWLIKTFTNEDEIVLDNCAASGSTLVAAKKCNRKFLGFDNGTNKDGVPWVEIANKRLESTYSEIDDDKLLNQ